ncbi:hypothetical protein RRG08_016664 [Elysia crispata]|uniref:Uncharacterized protein n=1 Tax=Elysia crispata TaxID=231223 RepID=A0AAE1CKV0_9GAST|nr:hypothetical protein RRG08_016664 [Elysia crispata]
MILGNHYERVTTMMGDGQQGWEDYSDDRRMVTTMIGGGQKRWEECSDDRRSAIMMGVTTVGIGNHDVGQP